MNRTTARTVLPLSALALVTITGTGLLFAGPLDPPQERERRRAQGDGGERSPAGAL
mgnify:CR=1 FL=1